MGFDNSHVKLSWALGFKKQAIKSWFELEWMQICSLYRVIFIWPRGAQNMLGENKMERIHSIFRCWV